MADLPWIKVWTVVTQHPKLKRLERELRIEDALGLVVRLWCWTADYHPDGDIPESDMDGAIAAARGGLGHEETDGDWKALVTRDVTRACVTAGFLEQIAGGFRVHDWRDMQVTHVEANERKREQARERQRRFRQRTAHDVTRDVTRDDSVMSRTERRGEERRKEEKRNSAEPKDAPAPAPVLSLPCSGPIKDFSVTQAMVLEWQASYPGVAVRQELMRAVQWARDNPTRRKTARGARRFLGAWLARQQDRGGAGAKRNSDPAIVRALEESEAYYSGATGSDLALDVGDGSDAGCRPSDPITDDVAEGPVPLSSALGTHLALGRSSGQPQDAASAEPGDGHGESGPSGSVCNAQVDTA